MKSMTNYARTQFLIDDVELSLIDIYQQRDMAIIASGETHDYGELLKLMETIHRLDVQIELHKDYLRELKK